MEQMLYLECSAGISGDMIVAALLDLGASREVLEQTLQSLPLQGFEIEISRVKKSGLDACDFNVKLESGLENHDHDMEYLHGVSGEAAQHSPEAAHTHEHHTHDHHAHEHHTHSHMDSGHSHRGLPEILEIIKGADMTERAREIAVSTFTILARAEARAHGIPMDQVHFHEVGAVDSIVDIVSAAVCLDQLGITQAVVPLLCEGTGTVRCQHGVIPVPVPAVANIVEAHKLALKVLPVEGELVTPTGAAFAAAIKTAGCLPESFEIERIGIGAGKRNYERPSLLRAMLIRDTGGKDTDLGSTIYKLESNIDDCTGETLGYAMERLLAAGARDVHYFPVFMKKNRPAYQLNVICSQEYLEEMEEIIFSETTTIGIRRIQMERTVLPRRLRTIKTHLGDAVVKECRLPNGEKRVYPEYDSAAALARREGIPFWQAYKIICDASEESGESRE